MGTGSRGWRRGAAGALLLAVLLAVAVGGGAVWAQAPAPVYEPLTRTDADYLYLGLALQQLMRRSSLAALPMTAVIGCTLWLLWRRATGWRPEPLASIGAYVVTSTLILTLFWPEAVRFGQVYRDVTPAEVQDVISNDGGARLAAGDATSAADGLARSGGALDLAAMVGTGGAQVPMTFHLILSALVDVPVAFGRAINAEATRPFEELDGFEKLNRLADALPSDVDAMFDIYFRVGNAKANDGDTTGGKLDGCHYPAAARLRAVHGGEVTLEQTYPWATAAPGVVTLRSMLGKEAEDDDVWVRIWDGWKRDFIFANSGGAYVEGRNAVPGWAWCDDLYDHGIENALEHFLSSTTTESGASYATMISTATGMPVQDQARFVFMVQAGKVRQEAIEHGSFDMLANRYVGASTASLGVRAAEGAAAGGGFWGAVAGLGKALIGRVGGEINRVLEFMRPAILLLMFAPYVTGIMAATVLAFFPVVVIWSVFPGQHFKPLMNYFLVLLFTQSAPIWWAMGDALADVALHHLGTPGTGAIADVGQFVAGYAGAVVVGVLSVFLVPVLEAVVLFGSWRVVGGLFKGF